MNKIENKITFKIKTLYHLKFLTPETMKLLGLGSTCKMTKDKVGESISHLIFLILI